MSDHFILHLRALCGHHGPVVDELSLVFNQLSPPTLGDPPSRLIARLIVFLSMRQHHHRYEAWFPGAALVNLSTVLHFPSSAFPLVLFVRYRTTLPNALTIL